MGLTNGFSSLKGVQVKKVGAGSDLKDVDLGELVSSSSSGSKTLVVLGTYAADFNAIEYGQRLKHYLPELQAKGVEDVCLVLNAKPESCRAFASYLELPESVKLLSDPTGEAGRAFGVSRGWLADDESVSPYAKLFGMLVGR